MRGSHRGFLLLAAFVLHLHYVTSQIFPCNTTTELLYQCNDEKTCVKRNTFCNGTSLCPDNSDEHFFNESKSSELGMKCQYLRQERIDKHCHLPDRYLCDHEMDCVGGLDECGCPHTFHCDNGDCAIKVTFCDGRTDCADGTDERKYNRTTKIGFQCPVTSTHETNNCILPDRYVCDGESDCDLGIDECFCDFSAGGEKGVYLNESYSNEKCFRCLDRSLIIPITQVCDGIVHCQDLSDECLCTDKKNYTMLDICGSVCDGTDCDCKGEITCSQQSTVTTFMPSISDKVCLSSEAICDSVIDCTNGIDEMYCADNDQLFECYDKKTKIKKSLFCNGIPNCADASDEMHCKELTNYFCRYYRINFPFISDWDNVTQTSHQWVGIPPGRELPPDYPFYTTRCDGVPMCGELDDECYAKECESNRPGYCKFVSGFGEAFRCPVSGSLIVGREICDGKPSCNDTTPEVSEDELFCPNRFYCANKGSTRRPIHIPMSGQCNGIQECDDQSDELNCSDVSHFYCKDKGSTLFVRRSEVCDGTQDCDEGSDECQNCNPSPFSSDKSLISSRILIVFLWIIGLVAVIGNLLVIIHQLKNLIRPDGNQSTVAKINRTLVLNLSLSDILVGIYLVSLGIQDAKIGEYCLFDQEWRSSSTCSALGTIALIGTETSVFILMIMTAYRLYLVVKPFKNQNTIFLQVAIVVAWFFSFLLALLPFADSMSDYFVSCVWYRNNEFFGRICHPELVSFTKELAKRGGESDQFTDAVSGGYTWRNMITAVKALNSTYVPERYFGYYSAHSVCLPRLFPNRDEDSSWGYSLFLILLNFFAFIFILVSYIFIYRKTTRKTSANKATSEDRIIALQRKVTRIVLTDFCCWMPICIMAFLKVSGVPVSDLAYAVTAIILLPINAAMNPFLYSDVLDWVWEKMLPLRVWFRGTACGQGIEKHLTDMRQRNGTNTDSAETRNSPQKTIPIANLGVTGTTNAPSTGGNQTSSGQHNTELPSNGHKKEDTQI
uniref:uncharacterized protein LOC120326605 n=1 Tax=Styela clava TaxID=7725 RepID=UPI001939B984|nr:uncharacterized protein LOC120326605 [Styela clava]